MVTPEPAVGLLDAIIEIAPDEIAVPSESQGGEISQEAALVQIDTYLHRIFSVGELMPWKGVNFVVVGIRGGIVGLAVKSVRNPPKARSNHGKRPSRGKRKNRPAPVAKTRIQDVAREYKEHPAIQGPIETDTPNE